MVRARTATDPCLWGEGEGDKSGAFAAEAKNVLCVHVFGIF